MPGIVSFIRLRAIQYENDEGMGQQKNLRERGLPEDFGG